MPVSIGKFVSGPKKCQNYNRIQRTRGLKSLPERQLKRKLSNGETHDRDWLIYSPSLKAVLCFTCKLFGTNDQNIEQYRTTGYNDWFNCSRSLSMHENSMQHLHNYLAYKSRANEAKTLDLAFVRQQNIEGKYWRDVLLRVVSAIRFLAKRGLAFRGSNETLGSSQNGNFLGILEFLSEFDPFLASHIQNHGNKGKGILLLLLLLINKIENN